jgi:hypothetical protein
MKGQAQGPSEYLIEKPKRSGRRRRMKCSRILQMFKAGGAPMTIRQIN